MKLVKVFTVVALMVAALAVSSWASGNEVKGTLNAVDVAGLTVTVNNQVYSVSANVVVKVEKQGYMPFSQLPNYVGQQVELKLNNGVVYKIEVKPGAGKPSKGGKLYGTLQAVDTANGTITVNGQTLSVSATVVIEVKQGKKQKSYIPFSELPTYIGKFVEAKYDVNQIVYKIEVKL